MENDSKYIRNCCVMKCAYEWKANSYYLMITVTKVESTLEVRPICRHGLLSYIYNSQYYHFSVI